jgi:hypothetical protein
MKQAFVFLANRIVVVLLILIVSDAYLKSTTNCSYRGNSNAMSQFVSDLRRISAVLVGPR